MSGGFQFTPSTTSSTAGGTGVGGFSFGTPSSQMFAFGTPSCSSSVPSATTASFGAANGTGSLFGANAQPSAVTATTASFTFGL